MWELPPPGTQGAQCGPPRVLGAGPTLGNDQHYTSISCCLLHHLLQATERGVRPEEATVAQSHDWSNASSSLVQ